MFSFAVPRSYGWRLSLTTAPFDCCVEDTSCYTVTSRSNNVERLVKCLRAMRKRLRIAHN